jgi:tetratricopeptide (TPR) repeat protein
MNANLDNWDDDLPPEPQAAYQDLLRALKRKTGFGLYFVQCTPVEADNLIVKLPQDIQGKHIEVLRLVESIDNLYERVAEFVKNKQVDILLIKGLEYSLYKYEKRTYGAITESRFSNLESVPHILNHLNQHRERFRDDLPFCFVFLLRSFSLNYLIHRAADFFDWRSGVFELPTTPELIEQESTRLLDEADYDEYLNLSQEQKIEKILEIQDLLAEQHQTESRKVRLLRELGRLLDSAKEYEAAIASYDKALSIQPDYHQAWNNRGSALDDLGRYQEAIASYDKALSIQPDDHQAWYNRGIALRNLGRYQEAIASYDKALSIQPDDHQAWYNRGIALRNLGRNEEALTKFCEAIASYDKALSIQPDDHYAWYGKACCYALQGNINQAIENLQIAINLNPEKWREWAKTDTDFDSIRDDERFQALIQE